MNRLSWMLYFADLSGSVSELLGIGVVLGAAAVIIRYVLVNVNLWEFEKPMGLLKTWVRPRLTISVLLFACIIATALPSKETIYAITASEMGEELAKTTIASKAEQAVTAWLDKQINTK